MSRSTVFAVPLGASVTGTTGKGPVDTPPECHARALLATAACAPFRQFREGRVRAPAKGLPKPSPRSQDEGMTRSLRRRLFVLFAALVVAGFVEGFVAPRAARADVWSAFKGRIFVSQTEFGSGYPTDAAMIAAIKKQSTVTVKGEGGWGINLAVFLKEAAGADKINIVYYDVSGKREQVNFSEVAVTPDQKMVELNGIALSPDLGFVKGHRYEVLATRLIGGKEKVYAKTTMTLK
jgi:hypothetical protein